ncbi:hypothetical protein GF354_05020 [Candidatus Peregrinibacteria bacterium]|nr:hypothetical protein [Candidatus Peregrinibacteria bacterium]
MSEKIRAKSKRLRESNESTPRQQDDGIKAIEDQQATDLTSTPKSSVDDLKPEVQEAINFFDELGIEFPLSYVSYLEIAANSGITFNYLTELNQIQILKNGDQILDEMGNPVMLDLDLSKENKEELALDLVKALKPVLSKYVPEKLPNNKYTELIELVKEQSGPNPGPISKAIITLLTAMAKYGPLLDLFSPKQILDQASSLNKLDVEDMKNRIESPPEENLELSIDPRLEVSSASANYAARQLLGRESNISSKNILVEKLLKPVGNPPDTFTLYKEVKKEGNFKEKLSQGSLILFDENNITYSGVLKEGGLVWYYDKTSGSVIKKSINDILPENIKHAYYFDSDQASKFISFVPPEPEKTKKSEASSTPEEKESETQTKDDSKKEKEESESSSSKTESKNDDETTSKKSE